MIFIIDLYARTIRKADASNVGPGDPFMDFPSITQTLCHELATCLPQAKDPSCVLAVNLQARTIEIREFMYQTLPGKKVPNSVFEMPQTPYSPNTSTSS